MVGNAIPHVPHVTFTAAAQADLRHFLTATVKIPFVVADTSPIGREGREWASDQFLTSFDLFARAAEALYDDEIVQSLRARIFHGTGFEVSTTDKRIICRLHVVVDGTGFLLERIEFVRHWNAPKNFKLYPMLADLSRIPDCPYGPKVAA